MSSSEIFEILKKDEPLGWGFKPRYPELYQAVMELWGGRQGTLPGYGSFASRLGRMRLSVYGDLRLNKTTDKHSKLDRWFVEVPKDDGTWPKKE
jgi:hypothetical protein